MIGGEENSRQREYLCKDTTASVGMSLKKECLGSKMQLER